MPRRPVPEINAGSMADIAFLLLIFFITATSMDRDSGITRLLPPMPDKETQQTEYRIRERNILVVLINRQNQVMVEGELTDISQLKARTIEFFENPANSPDLPEKEKTIIEFPAGASRLIPGGNFETMVSRGVVSIQNDRSTTYGQYMKVQNELVAGITELRNRFCQRYFGKDFEDLDPGNTTDAKIIEGISKIYRMNISEAEPRYTGGTE
jgi:biopolymer transport protein ExbD